MGQLRSVSFGVITLSAVVLTYLGAAQLQDFFRVHAQSKATAVELALRQPVALAVPAPDLAVATVAHARPEDGY